MPQDQPSPVPAAVRHRDCETHRHRVGVSVLTRMEIRAPEMFSRLKTEPERGGKYLRAKDSWSQAHRGGGAGGQQIPNVDIC